MSQRIDRELDSPTSKRMADVLALFERRWALRIVWELRGVPLTFRRLQAACGGVSPSVLQRRLDALRAAGIVEAVPRLGYRLSLVGQRLYPLLLRLEDWSNELPDWPASDN